MAIKYTQKTSQTLWARKSTNLSISATFGKIKGRLPALGLVPYGKAYKLKNSATRGSKKHGASISTGGMRKSQSQ